MRWSGRHLNARLGAGLAGILFAATAAPAAAPVVRVTGRTLAINGTTNVPTGLFGVHATALTPARIAEWGVEALRVIEQRPDGALATSSVPMVVQCFFDRYQPALVLTDPGWNRRLAQLGANYGRHAATGSVRYVEFWNEPYLNWAANPGVNYDGAYYDASAASTGAAMTIRGWDHPISNLVWSGTRLVAVPATGGPPNYVATRYMPSELTNGQMFTWRNLPFRTVEHWWGRDTTQSTWWSGPVNREFYHSMLLPFAQALKQANPDVRLIAGWGFHLHQDDWSAWRVLHQPLLDVAWQWIDGLDEHHYGGETLHVAGDYEVANAYVLAKYGKRLPCYNTEAGGSIDPEQPGRVQTRPDSTNQAYGTFLYTLRDILHLVEVCPDKAASRFAHEADLNGGDEFAFRLLQPLRGALVECRSANPDIWCVAALRGTQLCVAVYNDGSAATTFPLAVTAPASTAFTGARLTRVERIANQPILREKPIDTAGSAWQQDVLLPARSAARIVFHLNHPQPPAPPAVRVTQWVAGEILRQVAPGETAAFTVNTALPQEQLTHVHEVRLRYVTDSASVPWEKVVCTVDGNPVPLMSQRRDIRDVELPSLAVAAQHVVTFTAPPEMTNGFRICTVSILTMER